MNLEIFMTLDLPAILAGVLASVACALVGCFLVLRRMSLMGDAIAHAVLPGIVAAYLLTDSTGPVAMLAGAVVIGVATTALTELIHRAGRVDQNASMGVVFTTLFALGVIMLEQVSSGQAHLDADCMLYGQLEDIAWLEPPTTLGALFTGEAWAFFPREIVTLAGALALCLVFIAAFYKELKLSSFDPALSTALGFNADALRYALTTMTAVVSVASFEAVGSILVVALLIVPAMTARLLVSSLGLTLLLSAITAGLCAVAGYFTAAFLPAAFGATYALSTAGVIGVVMGGAFVLAALFAPGRGVVSGALRRLRISVRTAREDIAAQLHRAGELAQTPSPVAIDRIDTRTLPRRIALRSLLRRGLAQRTDDAVSLTDSGREMARALVRAHRLWETYLVQRADVQPDHVHPSAERLEHVTDEELAARLSQRAGDPDTDPHGSRIPRNDP